MFQEEERLLREEGDYIESDDDAYFDCTKAPAVTERHTPEEFLAMIVETMYKQHVLTTAGDGADDELDELDAYMRENATRLAVPETAAELSRRLRALRAGLAEQHPSAASSTLAQVETKLAARIRASEAPAGPPAKRAASGD